MTPLEFHPVADLFPMLADDDLAELAEDIKQRGLLQPIVLDTEGRVLDGRNRLAACRLAEVEPEFVTYEGDDPDGYAVAVNVARRHMTKGQQAVVMARAGYRNYTEAKISKQYVSWARAVNEHAPDLAARVLDGTLSLDSAYAVALDRKRAAEDARAKLDRLRAGAPDLVPLVDDERMSLDDAIAALDAREEKARQEADAARREAEARASEEERQRRIREQERQESLERDRERLRSVITGWPTMRNVVLADPDGPLTAEIVDGLGESDRLALKKIINEITE